MTDRELERRLRDWYATDIGAAEPAPPSLRSSVAAIPEAGPVPPMAMPLRRRAILLAAAALLVTLIAGTMAIGAGLLKLPAMLVLPSASDSPMPSATQASATIGLVAYENEGRLWVANADGTGARELLPDVPGSQWPIGWSSDGAQLLYALGPAGSSGGLGVTDAAGSPPRQYESLCPVAGDGAFASCVPDLMGASLSPDGTRLAYAIQGRGGPQDENVEGSAIVILDVATGQVTQLESTRTDTIAPPDCFNAPVVPMNRWPTWSPDGRQLIFGRVDAGPMDGDTCKQATFIVNADGRDLRPIAMPDELEGAVPRWSPDGSMFILDGRGIYTSQEDLTEIRAVGSGGLASLASAWTRDGRVVFIRWDTESGQLFPCSPCDGRRGELWIMDADGGNATQLEPTVPALTAAGCVMCPYPVYDVEGEPVTDLLAVRQTPPYRPFWITNVFWQPLVARD